mmetsp:Transcript_15254/g.30809  ORF Transcript_15254/g.30809 Transcript_15254/m.30809 type:complete len:223 (-) Transcript_15254:60-728(-)
MYEGQEYVCIVRNCNQIDAAARLATYQHNASQLMADRHTFLVRDAINIIPPAAQHKRKITKTYLLQTILGTLKSGNIVPLDIGLLRYNGIAKGTPQLGLLLGIVLLVTFPLLLASRASAALTLQLLLLVDIIAELFGAFHVSLDSFNDELLPRLVLLVLETHGESAERVAVQIESLFVLSRIVGRYGLADYFDRVGYELVLHGWFIYGTRYGTRMTRTAEEH